MRQPVWEKVWPKNSEIRLSFLVDRRGLMPVPACNTKGCGYAKQLRKRPCRARERLLGIQFLLQETLQNDAPTHVLLVLLSLSALLKT